VTYDFDHAQSEWSRPPLDELGYTSSTELLKLGDGKLRRIIHDVQETRYGGWRNHNNLWRQTLGLDSTHGKTILDFGCGAGIEALQFARAGNRLIVSDIVLENMELTSRVLALHDLTCVMAPIYDTWPYVITEGADIDVFYAAGVIHHIPYDREVMRWAASVAPEARLMLYSDRGWAKWVGLPVPEGRAYDDPRFETFLRTFDAVGDYADFYDQTRIIDRFGAWWDIRNFQYICDDDRYLTCTLDRKTPG
jgi:SAM-dependent methyltransferase